MQEYLLGRRVSGRVTVVGFHCDVISWRGADEASGSGELQRVFTGKAGGGGILCNCDFSPGKTVTVCDAAVCGTGRRDLVRSHLRCPLAMRSHLQ